MYKICNREACTECVTLELSERVGPNVDAGNLGVVALSPEYVSLHNHITYR